MKKKILFLSLLCFVVTGCSNLSNKSIDSLLPILLKENNKHYNVVYDGYKYYKEGDEVDLYIDYQDIMQF